MADNVLRLSSRNRSTGQRPKESSSGESSSEESSSGESSSEETSSGKSGKGKDDSGDPEDPPDEPVINKRRFNQKVGDKFGPTQDPPSPSFQDRRVSPDSALIEQLQPAPPNLSSTGLRKKPASEAADHDIHRTRRRLDNLKDIHLVEACSALYQIQRLVDLRIREGKGEEALKLVGELEDALNKV